MRHHAARTGSELCHQIAFTVITDTDIIFTSDSLPLNVAFGRFVLSDLSY